MLRIGLQLTLRSGREGLVRLLITAAAVAVGVALLLGVLAEFHAFQANSNRPCWSCTEGAAVPSTAPTNALITASTAATILISPGVPPTSRRAANRSSRRSAASLVAVLISTSMGNTTASTPTPNAYRKNGENTS